MNRIRKRFNEFQRAGRKALIPYVAPEFPLKGTTLPLLRALERSGASMIEVGMPFSDPLADGITVQRASHIAIQNGVTIPVLLQQISSFRQASDLPILLMGYINPILRFGMKPFFEACSQAGVDGVIVPDLPPEEADEFRALAESRRVSVVFLIAPTTSNERITMISSLSTDFSYCVSVTGVTGARIGLGANGQLESFMERVKTYAMKPFVVGFGVSRPEHVRTIWQWADGAVVGSALLQAIEHAVDVDEAARRASEFFTFLQSS